MAFLARSQVPAETGLLTEHSSDALYTNDLVAFTCNTSETKPEQAAAFRGLQITYWEKTILGCRGRESEVKSLREANEAGQHLMFAHRS